MFDGRFRRGVDRSLVPLGRTLVRTRVSPDLLTAAGLVLSVPTAVAVGSGHLLVGLVLLVASAVPDLLDGAVAKASGRSSARGAFLDSVCDRVSDTMVLGGVAWYLQDRDGGHVVLLPFAVLGASLLISYQRAKAESLGFQAKGGLMERAERVVALAVGLAFGSLLVPILWVMLALTVLTAIQRFAKVWSQASRAPDAPVRARPADRGIRAAGSGSTRRSTSSNAAVTPAARWRSWREQSGVRPAHTERFARGSARTGAAARWRERRLLRLERSRRDPAAGTGVGRWRGSRRP
jgi:CDP-diacylglycerol--glycerol-3-phosphate 3-phosphatidyltransferase